MADIDLLPFAVLAFLIETIVQTVDWAFGDPETRVGKWLNDNVKNWKRILALVVGPVLAIVFRFDLIAAILAALGYSLDIPIVGAFLTGLLLARGATILHDLTSLVKPAA